MQIGGGDRQYDITHATVPVRGEDTSDEKMLRRKRKERDLSGKVDRDSPEFPRREKSEATVSLFVSPVFLLVIKTLPAIVPKAAPARRPLLLQDAPLQ